MDTENTVVFKDRLLTCLDCGGEFIFTAGEQLFFADKQFKNDPKRCKPCKSRRSGASAKVSAGPAAAGISRTETRTLCSDCGIETTVPFKPTQGRPVLCRQCFQGKSKPAIAAQPVVQTPAQTPVQPPVSFADPTVSALTQASVDSSGAVLSQEAAVLAASSMSSASPNSSVATAADLASITGSAAASHEPLPIAPAPSSSAAELPAIPVLESSQA